MNASAQPGERCRHIRYRRGTPFRCALRSEALGLVGIVDEIVVTPDQVIVVDYKMASWQAKITRCSSPPMQYWYQEAFALPVAHWPISI